MALLLAVALYGLPALACGSVSPMAIPWKYQVTKLGSTSRGIPLTRQDGEEMGLRISTMFSDTRVQGSIVCEDARQISLREGRICEADAGGYLDTSSDFWVSNPSDTSPLTADPNDKFIVDKYLTNPGLNLYQTGHISVDLTVAVGENFEKRALKDYQFGVINRVNEMNQVKSGVGMGRWSIFLEHLYRLEYVPSKILGFYRGSYSDGTGRDGELVVGGVNLNAIDGQSMDSFKIFPIADVQKDIDGRQGLRCPLQVPISDFTVTYKGTEHSLFPNGDFSTFACVDTFQQAFTLPDHMMSQLIDILDARVDPLNSTAHPRVWIPTEEEKFFDQITIKIRHEDGEFLVVINGTEVSNPYETRNAKGLSVFDENHPQRQIEFRNESVNYPVEELPLMILAGAFLSRQYLMVDYSRNIFGLAPASLSGGVSNGTDLYKICEMEPAESLESAESSQPSGDRAAVIAVSVVAAIGWVLAICLACLLLFRFRRARKPQATEEKQDVNPIMAHGPILVSQSPISPINASSGFGKIDMSRRRSSAFNDNPIPPRKDSDFSTAPTIRMQRRNTGLDT